MKSKRKFYRTVIKVEVLSEEPYEFVDLDVLHDNITTGDMSGKVEVEQAEKIDAVKMAQLLEEQGSDAGFFQLTTVGEDICEEDPPDWASF